MSVYESKLISSREKMDKNHNVIKTLENQESKLLEKLDEYQKKIQNVREKIKKQKDIIVKRESRQRQLSEAVTKVSKGDLSKEVLDILQSEDSNKYKIAKLEGHVRSRHLDKITKVYRLLDNEVQSKCLTDQYRDADLKDLPISKKLEIINHIQSKIYTFLLKNRTENFMKYLINFSIDTGTKNNELDTVGGLYYITPELFTEVKVKSTNYFIIKEFDHPCNIIYNRNKQCVEDFVNSDIGYLPYQKLDVATYMDILRHGRVEPNPSVMIKNLEIYLKDNELKKYRKLIEKFNKIPKVLPTIGLDPSCSSLDSNGSETCSDADTIDENTLTLPMTCEKLLHYVHQFINKEDRRSIKYIQYIDIYERINNILNQRHTKHDCITLYNEFTTLKNL